MTEEARIDKPEISAISYAHMCKTPRYLGNRDFMALTRKCHEIAPGRIRSQFGGVKFTLTNKFLVNDYDVKSALAKVLEAHLAYYGGHTPNQDLVPQAEAGLAQVVGEYHDRLMSDVIYKIVEAEINRTVAHGRAR
jgi:hypothetical protein